MGKQKITEIETNNNENNIKAFFEKVKNIKIGYIQKITIRKDDGTIIIDNYYIL